MALSLYDISIPVFIRHLNNMSTILDKAKSYAEEKGIPLSKLTEARLADDMKPLTFQIQCMSNSSKGTAHRVAQTEAVPMDDNETTLEELQARIAKTVELLKKVEPSGFDGKLDAEVKFQAGPRELLFTGKSFVLDFALPNFFFHEVTAYDILRHVGVPVGKLDFLGSF